MKTISIDISRTPQIQLQVPALMLYKKSKSTRMNGFRVLIKIELEPPSATVAGHLLGK